MTSYPFLTRGTPGVSIIVVMLATFVLCDTSAATSDTTAANHPLDRVALEQRLGERAPLDLTFTDEHGQPVTLRGCTDNRPAVLVLAYYRCPMLCGLVLNGAASALRNVPLDAGDDFHIVVVSIDPHETPAAARKAKTNILKQYGRENAEAGWHFLTGDEPAIRTLADAVGYRYAYDGRTDQYAHPSGIMVVAPDGTLTQYLYGFDYSADELTDALADAKGGRTGSLVQELLLSCYLYDPTTGRYGVTIITAIRIGGALTVAGLLLFIGRALWRERGGPIAQKGGA